MLPFVHSISGFFLFAVIYGLDWFATVPPSMAITADTFGKENVGKGYGWIFMSHQIGAAIMASAAGALRTWLGDYHTAFFSGGVIALIAVINPLFVSTIVRAFGLNIILQCQLRVMAEDAVDYTIDRRGLTVKLVSSETFFTRSTP